VYSITLTFTLPSHYCANIEQLRFHCFRVSFIRLFVGRYKCTLLTLLRRITASPHERISVCAVILNAYRGSAEKLGATVPFPRTKCINLTTYYKLKKYSSNIWRKRWWWRRCTPVSKLFYTGYVLIVPITTVLVNISFHIKTSLTW